MTVLLNVVIHFSCVVATVVAQSPCHVYTAADADYIDDWAAMITSALQHMSAAHQHRLRPHVIVPGDASADTTWWRSFYIHLRVAWVRVWTGMDVDIIYGGARDYAFGRAREALRRSYAEYTTRAPHLRRSEHRQLAAAKLFVDEWHDDDADVVLILDADIVFSGRRSERLLCATARTVGVVEDPWYEPTDRELYSAAPSTTTAVSHRRIVHETWVNSGVLVVNVTWWAAHVAPAVRRYVRRIDDDRWEMFDQTVLVHAVPPSQRTSLPPHYNAIRTHRCSVARGDDVDGAVSNADFDDVCVLHSAGGVDREGRREL